jgi:serine/threonine protein kinase
VLDLGSEGDRDVIAGYIVAMEHFMMESSKYYESFAFDNKITTVTHGIDQIKYYFKPLSRFFSLYENDIEGSLRHYFNVMKTVFDCEKLRSSISFPICVYMENQTSKKTEYDISLCSLVFHNYSDYRIGFPSSNDQQDQFYNKLEGLVLMLHKSEVVHVDLFPSNIMWKMDENGKIEIKLID